MINYSELHDKYHGRAAAVLGGGPSLPGDLSLVWEHYPGALLVSVNHHAFACCEPDMMVYMDDPKQSAPLFEKVQEFDGLKICQLLEYTDVDLRGSLFWNGPGSSLPATWLACYMGCDPVLLCGMDLYQGEQKYCHADEGYKAVFDIPLEEHLRRWRTGFERCPGIERVRAASGPLVEMFGSL